MMDQITNFASDIAVYFGISQECAKIVLKDWVLDAVCLKLFLSRVLSIGIILGAVVVKIPQIMKLLSKKSVVGISLGMFVLETVGFTVGLSYSTSHGHPFSTYGESSFLLVQTLVLLGLHARYTTESRLFHGVFVAVMGAVGGAVVLGLVPQAVIDLAFRANIIVFSASKIPQIWTSFRTRNVEQLSLLSWGLVLAGNLGRVFTTIQEVNDPAVLTMHLVGLFFNAAIVLQIVVYGYIMRKQKKEE